MVDYKDRDAVLTRVRNTLAENFDCGIVVVSWEEEGETYHLTTQFGNRYATENLANQASDILFDTKEDDDDGEIGI
jgi:hypothetical protein